MKSDLEVAVGAAKILESALERNFGATGRGLHEKTNSVSARLAAQTVRDLHFIATIRNKIVHEEESSAIKNRSRFESLVDRLMVTLSPPNQTPAARSLPKLVSARRSVAVGSSEHSYFERFEKHRALVAIISAGGCVAGAILFQLPLLTTALLGVCGLFIGYISGAYIAGLAAVAYLVICLSGAAALVLIVFYWIYQIFIGK